MKKIRKLLIKMRLVKPKPHEKAELGQGSWGRQGAKTEPKSSISARVIRKDGAIEDLGILSGGK